MNNIPEPYDFSSLLDEDEDTYEEKNKLQNLFTQIKIKAQKRAIEDKLTQYYKKCIDEEQYQVFDKGAHIVLKEVHKMKTQADNITDLKQGKNPYCFYTVNFKPEKNKEDSLEEIDSLMKKFVDKRAHLNGAENLIYSIEQRSEGDDPVEGLHVHILFDKGKNAPSKIQRTFQTEFFDKWVGTHAALDYKYIGEDKVEGKVKYIMGIKDKDKMPKVERDRKMKDHYKIPHYYSKGFEKLINQIKSEQVIKSQKS
jgi:hypothetical protein